MAKKPKTEKPGTEVTNWEDQLAEEAREVAKTERPSINKIKFTSGIMSYMDTALKDNTLDCIIVACVWENVWYPDKWKANEVKPPGCFALGIPEGGEEPVMIAHDVVINSPGPVCKDCPKFEWASDPEGGRGKACKERRRLAVIPAPANLEDITSSDMAVMSIPVLSVKNWANYVNKLSAASQRPPWGVLTRVSLVPDAKSQFRVKFEAQQPLDSEQLPLVHQRIDSAVASLMIPYEMAPKSAQEEGNNKY